MNPSIHQPIVLQHDRYVSLSEVCIALNRADFRKRRRVWNWRGLWQGKPICVPHEEYASGYIFERFASLPARTIEVVPPMRTTEGTTDAQA